ncbi:zinc ABC transporter substrate-binding protein [Devosia sp.]|uniref:zinc ABC transporter substrate-binding protein n=1 Tax=Devosia sp. TaxID=1871048 RepID=UPI0035AF5990
MFKFALSALLAVGALATPACAEVPRVVASIKPVHALVAAVMGDLGVPALIVKGAASPHTYSLRPSDAVALQEADLVFWTGHGLELFLEDAITTLAPRAAIVELAASPGITLLPPREGGTFEPHAHDEGDHDHEEGHDHAHEAEADMHFFLDPENAKVMVSEIVAGLSAADPEHAATYAENGRVQIADLEALLQQTRARLEPLADRPFVVFHDAYQYFERRFDLEVVGSITVSPEVTPGADRIAEIRTRLKTLDAACVFAEPQFDPRIVEVLIEGSSARAGVLDPEGAAVPEGPRAYRELIEALAAGLIECLSP